MSDITVRLLDTSDLHEDALKFFNRHQVTNAVHSSPSFGGEPAILYQNGLCTGN